MMVFALLAACGVYAQGSQNADDSKKLNVRNVSVGQSGDRVSVEFTATADGRIVSGNEMLKVTPVLVSGGEKARLTPLAVRGRRAEISQQRRARAEGVETDDSGIIFMSKGQTISYESSVPAGFFGDDGMLVFVSEVVMCGNVGEDMLVASENLVRVGYDTVYTTAPVQVPVQAPPTVAEQIAFDFPFVAPVPDSGIRFTDELRDGSQIIFYEYDDYVIRSGYRDNAYTLKQIIAAINTIEAERGCRVASVFIAGFSSPEGSSEYNLTLSQRRAESLKRYVRQHTDLPDNRFTLHNGGADWGGLPRMLASSDMQYRDQIISVIDNTPVWDAKARVGRMSRIKEIAGGEAYGILVRDYFPELRNAAYLMVYFEKE